MREYVKGERRGQQIEVFERVADGLRIPGAMLNLAARPWEEEGPVPLLLGNGDAAVLRRDFVKLGAGIAATAVASVPAPTSGNRVGQSTVAQLRFTTVNLRRLDDHLGGGETFKLYLAEVRKTAHILKSARFPAGVRRELLELYAEQAQQAGWAAFDAGWEDRARQFYETSHSAAHAAGNDALAGNALALDAYRRVSNGKKRC